MGIAAAERLAPVAVLAELSACDRAEKAASARRLELAVIWAGLHPGIAAQPYDKVVDSLVDEATGVAVAAIAEFAAVHGISTNAGRQLIGDAVALHDRLPRCWQRMTELELPAWKARLLAQLASRLGDRAVAWLDAQAAVLGARLGVRTIRRFVLMAQARFEPDTLTDPNRRRWVKIGADCDDVDGAGWVEGRLDTPDALDLEAALRLIAADLAAEGVDVDLDARRAQALGVMARRMLGQPELPADPATAMCGAAGPGGSPDEVVDRNTDRADTPACRGGGGRPDGGPEDGVGRDANDGRDLPGFANDDQSGFVGDDGPGGDSDGQGRDLNGGGAAPAPDAGHDQDQDQDQHDCADADRRVGGGKAIDPAPAGSAGGGASDQDTIAPPGAVVRAGRGLRGGRPVRIYLHFDAAQLAGCAGLGELGSTGQLVTIDQLRAWCGTAGTITVRPVIDLNRSRTTGSYQPTEVMREHLALRDRSCVFPHCTRAAHPVRQSSSGEFSHDADHIVPHDSGGETSTENLACLCRLHHLLKTHTGWRYQLIGPGEYLWESPGGHQFLRTNSGTTMLTSVRLAS